jgi:hypothetical protein
MSDLEFYTLRWRGRETGPLALSEINRQLDEHEIGMSHEILCDDKWMTLDEFFSTKKKPGSGQSAAASRTAPDIRTADLTAASAAAPLFEPGKPGPAAPRYKLAREASPARSPQPGSAAAPLSAGSRRRMVYAFLAIFLGFLGLHNFYARQWLTGILQLLLSAATCLLGFGIIASWLWAMVEALAVRRDGRGCDLI